MGRLELIREGFSFAGRKPGLVSMRFALGFAIPLALFLLLLSPVVHTIVETLDALISAGGIWGVLENPHETISMLAMPMLLFYAVCLISLLAYMAGSSVSEARALRALAGHVMGREGEERAAWGHTSGRGLYRTLILYSLGWSVVSLFLLLFFGGAALIVSAIVSALAAGEGVLLKTMLILTSGSAFFLSILYLYSARLEGPAFIVLDGMRPREAFLKSISSLWQASSPLNLTAGMLAVYGLLQLLMALAAWGVWNVPDMGLTLVCIWGLFWIVLDIYLGLSIRATVFIAHRRCFSSGQANPETLTVDEIAGLLEVESGAQKSTSGIWEYFERSDGRESGEENRESPG